MRYFIVGIARRRIEYFTQQTWDLDSYPIESVEFPTKDSIIQAMANNGNAQVRVLSISEVSKEDYKRFFWG